MNLKEYWWMYQEVIPKRICDEIVKYGEHKLPKIATTEGFNTQNKKQLNLAKLYKVRNSHISWLDDNWIYREITPYIRGANINANWNFDWFASEPCQFTKYSTDQHYSWHRDSFSKPDKKGLIRKLSVTVSLADGDSYEGGDLEFWIPNKELKNEGKTTKVKIARKKGSVVIFPSFVWHRVTPITSGTRYSLVIWNSGYPYK